MVGLLITPIVSSTISGNVPLAIIDSPQAGTGKTLLAQIVGVIATGRIPTMMPYSRDSDELQKKVTSVLLADANVIVIDNVVTELNFEILVSPLTSPEWGDRLLDRNEMLRYPKWRSGLQMATISVLAVTYQEGVNLSSLMLR